MPKEVLTILAEVSQIAQYLWEKDWAERNAGNISIDLSDFFQKEIVSNPEHIIAFPLPPQSANLTLFVSGKGCHLRYLADKPETVSCILKINSDASGFRILWGGERGDFMPTSELITHIKIHLYNATNRPSHKAVLHTHPLELIVLSHHLLFQDEEKFNHSLWKMCPEIKLFVPEGIFCAPYALSGSESLANITIQGLEKRNIILWEKHGALSSSETLTSAFDFLDVANKAAKMLLLAWSAGFEPSGLSEDELRELENLI